jgi:hypothetical protein
MQEGQVMLSSTTTEVFINIEKAKDEALDFTTSLWSWIPKVFACLSDCYRKSLSLPLLDQHFIFGYLKPLMHIVWSLFSLQPFLFNLIKSYLLSVNSSSLSSLNLGARFLLRGGRLSHPEIPILECEPFSSINLYFQKDFIWFKLKWFYFVFKRVQRIKIFKWCWNFLLNYSFIQNFVFNKNFLLSTFIQKDLQKFIKSFCN